MLFSVAIYFFSYRIIKENMEEIYAASLEQARDETDSFLETVFRMLDQMTLNNNVRSLTFIQNKPTPTNYYTLYRTTAPFSILPIAAAGLSAGRI
jgi:hypothetical protein